MEKTFVLWAFLLITNGELQIANAEWQLKENSFKSEWPVTNSYFQVSDGWQTVSADSSVNNNVLRLSVSLYHEESKNRESTNQENVSRQTVSSQNEKQKAEQSRNRQNKGQQIKNQQNRSQQNKSRQGDQEGKSQQSEKRATKSVPTQENEYKIARESVGLEGIVVGKSTMNDVIEKFGKNYRWVVHKKYSYQMAYPNGLSFYICQSDKKKQVFDIEIKPPYKAKTHRGIILGKSTVEDVYRIYGKPNSGLEYKGVHFYYTNRGGKKIITTIDIVESKGIRQCDQIK
jgi:hypothetical protein